MNRVLPWAMLAMAPLSEARSGSLLSRRHNDSECCPCPAPGKPNETPTVTVTQPAQTVYVSQIIEHPKETVTVTAEPQTVYATHPGNEPTAVTQVVTVSPQPEHPQTVTVVNGQTQEPEPQHPKTVTVVNGQTQEPEPQHPKTVTVINGQTQEPEPTVIVKTIQHEGSQTASMEEMTTHKVVTITKGGPSSEEPQSPSVITITKGAPSESPQSPNVVTVTKSPEGEENPWQQKTVVISHNKTPESQAPKTYVMTTPEPTVWSAQQATVTAPPQAETIIKSVDHYTTLTKTVAGGGGDNIEIIIINIYTGHSSCRKKHSGKPCNSGGHQYLPPAASGSSAIPCPNVNATTSIETVYNTVLVTLQPGSMNATATAQAESASPMMTMQRQPRAPLSMRKW